MYEKKIINKCKEIHLETVIEVKSERNVIKVVANSNSDSNNHFSIQ